MAACVQRQGIAGADLSALQYTFIYADGADSEKLKGQTSDTNLATVGVLINTPGDDEQAVYIAEGKVDVYAGGAIEPYDYVMTDANGKAVVATTGKVILGQYVPDPENGALPDAASGDLIPIDLVRDKTRLVA